MFKAVPQDIKFPEMEKKWLSHWYKTDVVNKYLHKNDQSDKRFSFLDGPITANNPMGVHHAWGRTYKDLWPRFYNLLGYKQRFQMGFDCQGLWVEVEVEKELGLKNKKDIENLVPGDRNKSIAKFVDLCKQRVLKYSAIQTEQTKRLGNFADWDHSYFTMSDTNNYMIWHFLKVCYENGWIYKGHESVPWCPRCETAISEHEILTEDYKVVTHKSIYFSLPLIERKGEYLLVWTTTPWTIPANVAVAVDEKLTYALVESEGNKYWLLKDAVERVFNSKVHKVEKSVKGKELVDLKYRGPFDDLPAVKKVARENTDTFHTVIATDERILPISKEEGTGMVHTAVSAGTEDFKLGKKLGLPMIPVIDDTASYFNDLGFLAGKNAKKHPEIILDYLVEKDQKGPERWVHKIENYTHRYPGCWRCKTELVWKVADEWYIAMDNSSAGQRLTFRKRMMTVAKKIKWMPGFGLDRELDWLKNMHDWLISKKNRYWGLALPIYECKKCKKFEVIGSYEELKKRAIKGWDKFDGHTPHKPFIDEVIIKCNNCGSEVKRIPDVGNPWLDAGIVAYSTIANNNQREPLYLQNKKEWQAWFPVDFITESFPGQFKNWFYALIAESTGLENTNPFKTVLGYGTLLGEDGRPMHKSWGNSIEFGEGADKIGVDVMRWMFSRQNPSDNMLFGYKKADEVRRQFYLLLWNIYKFFVEYANLDKIDIKTTYQSANILDRWILMRLTQLINSVEENLKRYDAQDATAEAEKFVSDLSIWYIRRSRERVFVNSDDKTDKQSFYETLHFVLINLCIVLSPFMPFVTEEIYTNLTAQESIHLADWPAVSQPIDHDVIADMEFLRNIVEVGHSVRKTQLKIKLRQPLAKIIIGTSKQFRNKRNLDDYKKLIADELNIKKVEFQTRKKSSEEIKVVYDMVITAALQKEGALRDLTRQIQSERKRLGIKPDQLIDLTIPEEFVEDSAWLSKKVKAKKVTTGANLEIVV